MTDNQPKTHLLVEGAAWGDAAFYGRWLLAGAKANRLWKRARADSEFARLVDHLETTRILDLGIEATAFVMDLRKQLYSFVIELQSDEGESFAVMTEIGFFKWTGHHYQMAIPRQLTIKTVKDALLRLAATEDEQYVLHPEHLVRGMPLLEAAGWQHWLRELSENELHANAN